MDYGFSIFMVIFSAALLLYAGLMVWRKDYKMVPVRARQSVKPKDPRRYTANLAKVIALVAVAPALSGLAGLWNPIAAIIALIGGTALFIWIGTKIMKGVE